MKFDGEVAVVTGGGSGIGKAITSLLHQQGLTTVIFSRSRGAQVAEKMGQHCDFFSVDVTDFESVHNAVEQTMAKYGRIDYLVNNAGAREDKLILRMKPDDWQSVLQVNLTGVYNCTKAVLRDMMKGEAGSIVNISSVAALAGNPGQANYSAAKAGVIGFTKATAKEFASRNIRVNAVVPGFIQTAMTDDVPEERRAKYKSAIPLSQFGQPEHVAKAVRFLLSRDAEYITGALLRVDGGLAMN
ncbi:MAG: 3-oxoacyl-[acyl-carrier-protein] reductase [Candidatus Acetothermia bacterium]